MRRTEIVNVSFAKLVTDMKKSELALSGLSDSTVRTLLVTSTLTRSALQRMDGENLDPYLSQLVLQINWLAEQVLNDEGLITEESRLPAFHAVNRHVMQIEADTRQRLARPTIGLDASKDN